jgi:hypothetical protein
MTQADRPMAMPFGRYQLVQSLGHGGMAEVWRAVATDDDGTTRDVAVKRILPHLCDELPVVEMFLYEARLALRLAHPNLVRTLDVGVVAAQPYIAMELVDGIDLGRLNRGRTPLPIGFALSVVRDLCLGLGYLHSLSDDEGRPLGIIHRDVSHSNVMVQRDGTVKLLDFGVAKAALARGIAHTRSGEIKGKLGYMAPEMLRPGRYDHRIDLFAAGVVLFELLTQRRLFDAAEEGQLIYLNMQCQVPAPSRLNPRISPALEAIVLRALERAPARRYRSGADMVRDLERELQRQPWTKAESVRLVQERLNEPLLPAPARATEWPSATATQQTVAPRRLRTLMAATGAAAAMGIIMLVATLAPRPQVTAAVTAAPAAPAAIAYGDDSVRVAAASGWELPAGASRLASAELEVSLAGEATATGPKAPTSSSAPSPPPSSSASPARGPAQVEPSRSGAHHPADRGSAHVARGHKTGPAELHKVVEQTGLLDVYRH